MTKQSKKKSIHNLSALKIYNLNKKTILLSFFPDGLFLFYFKVKQISVIRRQISDPRPIDTIHKSPPSHGESR